MTKKTLQEKVMEMTKEERFKEFKDGFLVQTYDGADLYEFGEGFIDDIEDKAKDGKVDYSLLIDMMLEEGVLDFTKKNGTLSTDDIILVNHDFTVKDDETATKKSQAKSKKILKESLEKKTAYINEIDKLKKESDELDKEHASLRKKKSRAKTQAEKDKIQKRIDTLVEKKAKIKEQKDVTLPKLIKTEENRIERMTKALNDEVSKGITEGLNKQQIDEKLIENGFNLTKIDADGNKITTHYTYHPHTSSKGRNIKDIYVKDYVIINDGEKDYSRSIASNNNVVDRLGLKKEAVERYNKYNNAVIEGKSKETIEKLKKDAGFQLVEYDAYNALNQSAVNHGYTKPIMPENIIIVDDLDVDIKCNAMVESLKDGQVILENVKDYTTKNTMWDGMCLVDSSAWQGDSQFALLRQEMFKSGATKVELQTMLKDSYRERFAKEYTGDNFEKDFAKAWDKAYITDVYGEKKLLKDCTLLTTTNSSKFDKFAKFKYPNAENPKAELKKDWDNLLRKDGGKFAIVKTEHASKFDEVQQISYQMFNSFDFGYDIEEVEKNMITTLQDEFDRINRLKESDAEFIKYLEEKTYKKVDGKLTNKLQAEFDNDQYILKMVERNPEIINTREFKEFKSKEIAEVKDKLTRGKAKFLGDNMTLVGDPKGLVNNALGGVDKDNIEDFIIFNNEPCDYVKIYSPKFAYKEKVVAMRSPHCGDFSIVVCENQYNAKTDKLGKYFDLGENLCVVDNTKLPFQDMTAGSDLDSDFCYMSNDKNLVNMAERSWGKRPVPVNKIDNTPVEYMMDAKSQAIKDFKVGASNIGEVANTAQLAQSQYTHMRLHPDEYSKERIKGMEEILYRANNAQGIAIDNAKRQSDLSLAEEMEELKGRSEWIRNDKGEIQKPDFFKNVQKNSNKNKMKKMDCNMDIMKEITDKNIKNASKSEGLDITEFIIKPSLNSSENEKVKKILAYVDDTNKKISAIRASKMDKDMAYKLIQMHQNSLRDTLKRSTLDQNVYKKLVYKAYTDNTETQSLILKVLAEKDMDKFMNCFKEGKVKMPSPSSLIEIVSDNINDVHFGYGKRFTADLEQHIDEFCKGVDNIVNNLYYSKIEGLTEDERAIFLASKLDNDEVKELSAKWNIGSPLVKKMTRLQAIEKDIAFATDTLKKAEETIANNLLRYSIKKGHDKTIADIERLSGKKMSIPNMTDKEADKILKKKFLGKNFIERINHNAGVLRDNATKDLEKNLIGKSKWSMKKHMEFIGENHKWADRRLITTEITNYYNRGVQKSYEDMGFTDFIYVAVMDNRTSKICREMNGKVFSNNEAEIGVNVPPLHPWCRSTTIPRIELSDLLDR